MFQQKDPVAPFSLYIYIIHISLYKKTTKNVKYEKNDRMARVKEME